MKRLMLLLLAMFGVASLALATEFCIPVTDPCMDRGTTSGEYELPKTDSLDTYYIYYHTCPGCKVTITCKIDGRLAWEHAYTGDGYASVPYTTRPGSRIEITTFCFQDPTGRVQCSSECLSHVDVYYPGGMPCKGL